MLQEQYLRYTQTDRWFYERPDTHQQHDRATGGQRWERGEYERLVAVPEGWREIRSASWRSLAPAPARLPEQGWKIHVAAVPDNAERVLETVAAHCLATGAAFKHLPSRRALWARNAKHAARGHSGKFLTVYPGDETELAGLLEVLAPRLAGEPGPRILSDLRIGAGPLHVRYGGFTPLRVAHDGQLVPALRRPDGVLVPDRREPRFVLPDWVDLPGCLRPHQEASSTGDHDRLPFTVTAAVMFSNGGGVYRATRTPASQDDAEIGDEVILKEARPHAGWDATGRDAVARLAHEHAVLTRLAGIPGVPRVGELLTVAEHRFLPEQTMPGITLSSWVAGHYPLATADPDPASVSGYTARATRIAERVAAVVAATHARGVAIGDLHPRNVLVDDHDQVSLVDFEVAGEVEEPPTHGLAAPGFRAPTADTGAGVDRYALAVLRLWMFHPTAPILAISREPLPRWIDYAERRFALPAAWATTLRRDLGLTQAAPATVPAATEPDQPDGAEGTHRLVPALIAGIHGAASPDRADRLFPGDIRGFDLDGLCFGHGAAGVLHALRLAGDDPTPDHETWLLDKLARYNPDRGGLWDGAPGIAYALDGLGHNEAARDLLRTHLEHQPQLHDHHTPGVGPTIDLSVRSGLAGTALVTLELADRHHDERLRDHGLALAERLATALATDSTPGSTRTSEPGPHGLPTAGLLEGWTGPSLVQVAAFEHTGDPSWLHRAETALRRDLDRCRPTAHGALQAIDPAHPRTLPYLARGSAGVALAALALHAHQPDRPSLAALPALLGACRSEFVAHPGLGLGAAGLILTLRCAAAQDAASGAVAGRAIMRLAELIARQAVPYADGLIVAGHQLHRLSTDLDTGNAGVLLALTAHTAPAHGLLPLPGLGHHRHAAA